VKGMKEKSRGKKVDQFCFRRIKREEIGRLPVGYVRVF